MKNIIATGVAATIISLSMNTHASSMTFVDYTLGTVDYDAGSDDGDYSALTASIETPIIPIISVESIDLNDFDILKAGLGSSIDVGSASNIYGLIHYNDYEGSTDSDFSFRVGINSTISDRLEVRLSHTLYSDQDGLDNTKLSLGYYLTPHFSLSGNYQIADNFNIMSATARLSF
ncbi:hypothetical protein EBI01_02195 [Marinomonas rhizomae]|uniref:Outer membrane protein with beta-barrel domain n=1 Tax=Marinomonas rhizomae TaxID=491948 RepID=A0A366JFG5_9GAMM|nr:hypothetical protein [Marinomonas rhizomae]RBP85711.1 hypothetical protein DFP80_101206 [Marinomonas rhizomae]RNF75665.1 hypothetical protein EBI01_02195 [Marinomonas rhizomae]